jgi:hypothetical protein
MIVRVVTTVVAAALLAGCSTEEGMRAQELLQQAEAAQQQLRSATFDGSMRVVVDGMDVQMLFTGATSPDGEWFSLRTSGVPDGGDLAMQVLVRGGRSWMNMGEGWQATGAAPTGSSGTMSADAFQQLARYVKDVRVTEHQLIDGKAVTTIAGEIDTQGMMQAFAKLSSFAPGESFDLSGAGIDLGDIHAVLTIDERTHLLDTAYISFAMSVQGKSAEIEVRYRLASANEPVELPRP